MSSFSVRNILNLKEPRMQANNTSNAMNLSVYQTDNGSFEPRSKLDMGLHLAQKTQESSKFIQRRDNKTEKSEKCILSYCAKSFEMFFMCCGFHH